MRLIPAISRNAPGATRNGTSSAMLLRPSRGGRVTTMDGLEHDVGRWDMLIAHPPCTYLTSSGAARLFDSDHSVKDPDRFAKGIAAAYFFRIFLQADIPMIAVENPTPLKVFGLPRYSQIIEPFQFGDPWRKRTCLWLKGLPRLVATDVVEPEGLWVGSTSARRVPNIHDRYRLNSIRDSKKRSKTFPGIARAMAEQWGGDIRKEEAYGKTDTECE